MYPRPDEQSRRERRSAEFAAAEARYRRQHAIEDAVRAMVAWERRHVLSATLPADVSPPADPNVLVVTRDGVTHKVVPARVIKALQDGGVL
jgi:hypothetical protein